jgi:hypothetical protein
MRLCAGTAHATRSRRLSGFAFLRLLFERVLYLLDHPFERDFISDRQVGKNLPVEPDPGGLQALGETAVGSPLRATGGVEPLHPEHAEVALPRFAVAIGPILCFHRRVFGVTKEFRPATPVTFGGFEDAFAALAAGGRISGSWHAVLPESLRAPRSANCSYC